MAKSYKLLENLTFFQEAFPHRKHRVRNLLLSLAVLALAGGLAIILTGPLQLAAVWGAVAGLAVLAVAILAARFVPKLVKMDRQRKFDAACTNEPDSPYNPRYVVRALLTEKVPHTDENIQKAATVLLDQYSDDNLKTLFVRNQKSSGLRQIHALLNALIRAEINKPSSQAKTKRAFQVAIEYVIRSKDVNLFQVLLRVYDPVPNALRNEPARTDTIFKYILHEIYRRNILAADPQWNQLAGDKSIVERAEAFYDWISDELNSVHSTKEKSFEVFFQPFTDQPYDVYQFPFAGALVRDIFITRTESKLTEIFEALGDRVYTQVFHLKLNGQIRHLTVFELFQTLGLSKNPELHGFIYNFGAALDAKNTTKQSHYNIDLLSSGTGDTPLHTLAKQGETLEQNFVTKYLSSKLVTPQRPNRDGDLPYELAPEGSDMRKLLQKVYEDKAKLYIEINKGTTKGHLTPGSVALHQGRYDVLHYIFANTETTLNVLIDEPSKNDLENSPSNDSKFKKIVEDLKGDDLNIQNFWIRQIAAVPLKDNDIQKKHIIARVINDLFQSHPLLCKRIFEQLVQHSFTRYLATGELDTTEFVQKLNLCSATFNQLKPTPEEEPATDLTLETFHLGDNNRQTALFVVRYREWEQNTGASIQKGSVLNSFGSESSASSDAVETPSNKKSNKCRRGA